VRVRVPQQRRQRRKLGTALEAFVRVRHGH
jgi:hypothetical protein